jgi:stearoyl-CoA 9-desaturase NADPH oxidoreductase
MAASPSRSVWSRIADVANVATTPLAPSHYLELVRPLSATHTLNARVESVSDETADTRTLVLRPGRGWRAHRAGQFVRVGAAINGRIVTRTYSISSSPDRADRCITITVKAMPLGKMSRFLARDVRPGAYLTLGLPEGDFVLPAGPAVRPLFLTGGSGITPVMSMIRTFALRRTMPDAVHIHYAPSAHDTIFAAEIGRIAAEVPSYRPIVFTTRDGAHSASRFSTEQLEAVVPDWRAREVWACGPQGLLEAIESSFAQASLQGKLTVERFRPKLAPPDPNASGGRVRFGLSRTDVEATGHTPLLEVAERAGVKPLHGCRIGICHSCDATMVSGCVRDLRTGNRIDEPGTRVQICVCAAAGDVEIAL